MSRFAFPVRLVLDWDMTLTTTDTLHLVAQAGYNTHALPLDGPSSRYPSPLVSWSELGKGYMTAYNSHKAAYRPAEDQRTTLVEERAWLASLAPVEQSSADRAARIGLFEKLTRTYMASWAEEVAEQKTAELRGGWQKLFRFALAQRGSSISVLSVNWSATFIRERLRFGAKANATNSNLAEYIASEMEIKANEVVPNANDGLVIRTSADKLRLLGSDRCRRNLEIGNTTREPPSDRDPLTVYVGDSDTDLECLLAADIGICIQSGPQTSSQQKLAATLSRLNMPIRPVGELSQDELPNNGMMWAAKDFDQIQQALEKTLIQSQIPL